MLKNNQKKLSLRGEAKAISIYTYKMLIRILQITIIFITIFAINSVLASIKADTYKKEGKESLKKNFPYLAVDKFSKALKLDNSDGEARGYLGISYTSLAEKTNKGDLLKKAIYEMKDARKTYEDSSINYQLAKTYELAGDVDDAIQEAIKSYNQIPSGQTKDKLIALYKIKGDMLLSQNKRDETIKFYTKYVELKGLNVTNEDVASYEFLRDLMPDIFFVRYCLAILYKGQNLWDKAIIELEHIRKIGISNEDIIGSLLSNHYEMGIKYYNDKKYKEAESPLIYILNFDSINRFGYTLNAINTLSSVYEQAGDIDKAVDTWMKLESFDTQKGQGYYQIGHLFNRIYNYQKAAKYYEKYLQLRSVPDPNTLSTVGWLHEQVGDIDKAVETFIKLEEIDTQKGQGYYQIAHLFNRKSNPQKAIEYFEKYLPFRSVSEVNVFYTLGNLYEQVGDVDKAVEIYSKLEDINYTRGQGHYYTGLLYEKKERWVDALREFECFLQVRPEDSQILQKIGQVYEKMGNNKKALEIYKKVIALNPLKEAELIIPMVRIYEKMGEREKAASVLKSSKR